MGDLWMDSLELKWGSDEDKVKSCSFFNNLKELILKIKLCIYEKNEIFQSKTFSYNINI